MGERPTKNTIGIMARLRRDSKPIAAVERFVTAHKVIAAAIALVVIGATAATVLSGYASKADVGELRARDAELEKDIQRLREVDVEMRSSIKAVTEAARDAREDLKALLQHVLATPVGADATTAASKAKQGNQ